MTTPEMSLNVFTMPPIPSSIPLPPLPEITDPVLAKMAVTHASVFQGPRKTTAHELQPGEELGDYEKLEHVGDGLLGAVVTCLLHDLYPHLRPGTATMLKTHLVSNHTLAQLSIRYGLPERLIAAQGALYVTRAQQKTKANLFEAHVAGVFYSYLQSEVPKGPNTISVIVPGLQGRATDHEDQKLAENIDGLCFEDEELSNHSKSIEHILLSANLSGGKTVLSPELSRNDNPQTQNDPIRDETQAAAKGLEQLVIECISKVSKTSSEAKSEDCPTKEATSQGIASIHDEECKTEQKGEPDMASCTQVIEGASSQNSNLLVSSALTPTNNRPSRGQAFDYLDGWLRPLYVPLAEFALENMRIEQARLDSLFVPSPEEEPDAHVIGARGVLSQHVIDKMKGPPPRYEAFENGIGSWKVVCKVRNKIGEEWTAEAARPTKKAAASVAAYDVCQQLHLDVQ